MAIDNIGMLAAVSPPTLTATQAPQAAPGSGFDDWLHAQLNEVNSQIAKGEAEVRNLATGAGGNLHDVMIDLEKAKLSFELILAVRNKSLEAYQELMRMQI
jgi:flagellar hook-basal body complex protein FliE